LFPRLLLIKKLLGRFGIFYFPLLTSISYPPKTVVTSREMSRGRKGGIVNTVACLRQLWKIDEICMRGRPVEH